jgi:Tol biopolymer transport system component
MDDSHEFVGLIAVLSSELDEFSGSRDHGGLFGRTGNGDASAAAKLEQALLAQFTQCAQDGVGVDAEHRGEVFCRRQPFAGLGLAVCDRAADLGGYLLVQQGGVLSVDLDTEHGAMHSSVIRIIVLWLSREVGHPDANEPLRRSSRWEHPPDVRIPLALFAALLLLSVGSGATASTTTPPRNGLIAVEGPEGIYIVDPRTATAHVVPMSLGMGDPTWSPDGTLLAVTMFESDRFPNVYTMKPDGSEQTLLRNASYPSWSPDGKQLVVVREGTSDGDANSLAIVDADGSEARSLDLGADEDVRYVAMPEWSPDGKLIAFVDGNGSIRLFSPEGKAAQVLDVGANGSGLSWSPDSTRLAFDRHVETKDGGRSVSVVLDVATGQEAILAGEQHGALSPTWSPQGDQIAFISMSKRATSTSTTATSHSCGGEDFVSQLWVMSPEGTKAHQLVEGEYYGQPSWARSLDAAEAPPADTEPEQQPLPAPSADTAPEPQPLPLPAPAPCEDTAPEVEKPKPKPASGRRLELPSETDGLIAVRGSVALYLADPASGVTQKIPDTSDMVAPAWSPDAKLLAVERVGKAESSIWTIRPDGTDPQLVLPNASLPSWSPAGDRIYAVRNECAGPCEPEDEAADVLFSVRPDGKDVREVEAEEDVDREFAWAPDGNAIGFFADENLSNPGTFDSLNATWSPDGTRIAFVGAIGPFDEDTATAPPPYGLWVVSVEGGTPRLLVKGASGRPSWAPHG